MFNCNCSALVEKAANLKVTRVCNTLITFKFAFLQGTAEQLRLIFEFLGYIRPSNGLI